MLKDYKMQRKNSRQQPTPYRTHPNYAAPHLRQQPPVRRHRVRNILIALVLLLVAIKVTTLITSRFPSHISEIKSGIAGYCLDDHHNAKTSGTIVTSWSCNGSAAQAWTVSGDIIKHGSSMCLTAQTNNTIVANSCSGGANQIWVSAIDGYENPATARCLAVPSGQTTKQLTSAACTQLTEPSEAWSPLSGAKLIPPQPVPVVPAVKAS